LVLGSSNPKSPKTDAEQAAEEIPGIDSEKVSAKVVNNISEIVIAPIDSTKIFAETIADLLTNESINKVSWHDPTKFPVDPNDPESVRKWGEYLARFDCVVILSDDRSYDVGYIQQNQPNVIDVRSKLKQIVDTASDERLSTGQAVEISPNKELPDVIYTGVVPIVYKAQRTLLNSLIESTVWAFVTILPVMAVIMIPATTVLGNLRPHAIYKMVGSGFVAMLPNVFPIVIVFGAMGFMGSEVDIGSMMTASVAMGIAVDETIHFMSWFRAGARLGLSRIDSIMYAYRRVAPAMTQTTIVGGLGLSVFALSTFTPTQRFGTLMLTILTSGILGELIFLPALLASPLGKLFMPYPDMGDEAEHTNDEDAGGSDPAIYPIVDAENKNNLLTAIADDSSINEKFDSAHGRRMHNHLKHEAGMIQRIDKIDASE